MQFYNAGRQFFTMKADAEKHAKLIGEKGINVIVLKDRNDAVSFLTLLVNSTPGEIAEPADNAPPELQGAPRIAVSDEAFAFVPDFVKADWDRRRKMVSQRLKGE